MIREALGESAVDSSLAISRNGEDALDYLFQRNGNESATRPDIVILDLNVPKVNGRAVLEAITDDPDLQSVPVIVLSGSKAPDDILETYKSGAEGYLVKPTDPNEFIATVRTVAETVADDGPVPEGEYADLDPDA